MEIRSALHLSMDSLAAGLTKCFEGYIMPAHFSAPLISAMVRIEAIDLSSSLIAEKNGEMVGATLIARRGATARVAAMAIAPSSRRQGLGKLLMDRALEEGRSRGERRMVLEVIEQNPAAINLYESAGMSKDYRLLGFSAKLNSFEARPGLEPMPLTEVANVVRARGERAASWSMSAANIEQLSLPSHGVRTGDVYAVLSPAGEERVACRSLGFVGQPTSEAVSRWLQALAHDYPNTVLQFPAFFPEPEFASALTGAGMNVDEISQFQMSMAL